MPVLRDLVDLLHGWYPPHTAEAWDAVGLVSGHPDDPVTQVMFAVDPSPEVAAEAVEWGADLLVTHHPLFLRAVHGVAATTPKGRTLTTLMRGGCALLSAHTNADQAESGVSQALATALGLEDQRPITPAEGDPIDKLTVFVPDDAAAVMRAALGEAGAGSMGDYDMASFSGSGLGRFRPLEGATPMIGTIGEIAEVPETRIEVILPRGRRREVVAALLGAHPYEEPGYDIVPVADTQTGATGTGRIGTIERMSLADFAAVVAGALPETEGGVRVAGDPRRSVRRVAVCGGAGDFLLDEVLTTDADVYVTSDLRHHPASEFVEKGGPALVDVAHWAAESTWLPVVDERLRAALGDQVQTRVSTTRTDPWTLRVGRTTT